MLARPRVVTSAGHTPARRSRGHVRALCLVYAVLVCVMPGTSSGATSLPATFGHAFVPSPVPSRAIEVRYQGTIAVEGHYRRPGELRLYNSSQCYRVDGNDAVRLDWSTWAQGDSLEGPPESFLVVGDRVFHRDDPGVPWRRLTGERAELAHMHACAGVPWEVLRDRRMASAKRSVASRLPAGDRAASDPDLKSSQQFEATFSERTRNIWLETRARGRVGMIQDRLGHARLGNVANEITYRYDDDEAAPQSMRMKLYEGGHSWLLDQRLVSYHDDADSAALLVVPANYDPPEPAADSMMAAFPAFHALAPGVWAADMDDLDTRSLVVEFASDLALIEMAGGSANGERLVDAIKAHWPSKRIRHALFSHHHPHYAGGLRALVAEGATLVTTPGNEALVRDLVARPWTIAPDRLARKKNAVPPDIRTFKGRFELADSTQRLVAVDIGARSDHTDEFVIFALPGAGIVFEAEQGWVTVNDTLRAARRAERFLRTLEEEKIVATRFVQSWPMRGEPREVSRAELEALIRKRRK